MPFMKPEIYQTQFLQIDGPLGVSYIPLYVWAKEKVHEIMNQCSKQEDNINFMNWMKNECYNADIWQYRVICGWGARLSVQGYCTEWSVYKTEKEARKFFEETHEICSYCGEDMPQNMPQNDSIMCQCGNIFIDNNLINTIIY